jgi:hypothetical protein
LLRPQYVALTQDRLFVVESDRPIRPDVSIFETHHGGPYAGAVQSLVADPATVVEFYREEVSQPFIEIIEPSSGNRVVTAIEVLSPDNKAAGAGANSYARKQQELWEAGTNLVEIDLLSAGTRSTRVSRQKISRVLSKRYLVTVTREFPTRCEFYGIELQQPLPRIAIPLKAGDKDVPLDLQAVFTRCYDSGPYPQFLYYDKPAPSKLNKKETTFVCASLKKNID